LTNDGPPASPLFGAISLCASATLIVASYLITGPGVGAFNAFNDRVFSPYYTAGALLMLALYGSAFFFLVGLTWGSAVIAWVRKEQPKELLWTATAAAIAAPAIAVKLFANA